MRLLMLAVATLVLSFPFASDTRSPPSNAAPGRPALTEPDRGASADAGGKYWVREYKRRWKVERRDGRARAATIRRLRRQLDRDPTVGAAICAVFGSYCGQARRVAWCESRYYTGAGNGQYRGLFQMGSSERRTYGHGATALVQALAAWRYFVASGRDWSPWECKP